MLNLTTTFGKLLFPQAVWHFDRNIKTIYLTFDDGPCKETTNDLLNLLDKYQIKATFFLNAKNCEENNNLFTKVEENKHSIGNHGYQHQNLLFSSKDKAIENIGKANKIIKSNLFRPPYGKINLATYNKIKQDYKIIMWDVLSKDYSNISNKKCLERTINLTKNGSIVVFHENIKAKKNLFYTLPRCIEYFLERNYKFDKII